MSNVAQLEKLVSDADAVVNRIAQGPKGKQRLIISILGGLVTKEVPPRGTLSEDATTVTAAAQRMVMTAKMLTGQPARHLSSLRSSGQSPSHR
jgi:hypothetical protein